MSEESPAHRAVSESPQKNKTNGSTSSSFDMRQQLGRRGVSSLFERGAVRVDGRVAKKGDRARAHSTVTVDPAAAEPITPDPHGPLDVRLEARDLVVVNKPAGQPTAPVRAGETATLANVLLVSSTRRWRGWVIAHANPG